MQLEAESSLQNKLRNALEILQSEAVDNGNVNVDETHLELVDLFEAHLFGSFLSADERRDLDGRLNALRYTLELAIGANRWGKESYDLEDEDAVTDLAIPVLVASEFYEPIFEAVSKFEKANPEPIFP